MYDASGQRYAKIEQPTESGTTRKAQATVYLGDTELTDSDTADTLDAVTGVRYFTFAGATVAVQQFHETQGVTWFYLFGDFQGSAQLMMPAGDPATQAAHILRNAYTPYGAGRSYDFDGTGAAALSTERGWLSQVADEATATLGTGLTYLNARYYDPLASRFLTPDPLMDVMDPKTLDPYRYADNNPIVFTDATGLASVSCPPGATACIKYANSVHNEITGQKRGLTTKQNERAEKGQLPAWSHGRREFVPDPMGPTTLKSVLGLDAANQDCIDSGYANDCDNRIRQNVTAGNADDYADYVDDKNSQYVAPAPHRKRSQLEQDLTNNIYGSLYGAGATAVERSSAEDALRSLGQKAAWGGNGLVFLGDFLESRDTNFKDLDGELALSLSLVHATGVTGAGAAGTTFGFALGQALSANPLVAVAFAVAFGFASAYAADKLLDRELARVADEYEYAKAANTI